MKQDKKIAIIGGGASGLFLSILLKKKIPSLDITIYEAQNKVGKKILQTGNGKCNLANMHILDSDYNTKKIDYVLNNASVDTILNEFKKLGLKLRVDEEGRVYPHSERATTVLDILMKAINELGIKVLTDTCITDIIKNNNSFILKSQNNTYNASYVIMCTGGKSSITFKYNAYDILRRLGHTVTSLSPSLCALKTKENTKALSGIRVKCRAKMIVDNKIVKVTDGEVLFKDNGLSGVAIFILSQFFDKNKKCIVSLDLFKDETIDELNNELYNKNSLSDNLIGYFPKMVNQEIVNRSRTLDCGSVIKDFRFEVVDTFGFNNAQVTKGGVLMDEVNNQTFESKKCNNLYLAGEVLDVDGSCGGYNLYFAFSSSYLIAEDIEKKILGEL